MAAPVRIGTSGFAFAEWVGSFYPHSTPPEQMLGRYAERLRTVELSATFHRLPALPTVLQWRAQIPGDFRLCLTAPRQLTRDLRLARSSSALAQLRRLVQALGDEAGPVLFQIAPSLGADLPALGHFLDAIDGIRAALDLRHPSWRSDACLRILSAHEAALVATDEAMGMPRLETTTDFAYWRLRRSHAEPEGFSWTERAALLAKRGIEVFAFVKPDRRAHAPVRAMALDARVHELLGRRERPAPTRSEVVYH